MTKNHKKNVSSESDFAEQIFARARDLQTEGLDWLQAMQRADMEARIRSWPSKWGDDFHVLIYGDFNPPENDLIFRELGIIVHA